MRFKIFSSSSIFLIMFAFALPVFAHEVYVLDQTEIDFALRAPSPDFVSVITDNPWHFVQWGCIVLLVVLLVFMISTMQGLERRTDKALRSLKKYAPKVAQLTLGSALIASGYYHSIFGVELPLHSAFGQTYEGTAGLLLVFLGLMFVFGIMPRIAAVCTVALFSGFFVKFGFYMTNYATYAGEALTLAIFGGAYNIHSNRLVSGKLSQIISEEWYQYKYLIIRVFFGISLIYASIYAKFIYGALALETVLKYNLTEYFPFDPTFLVLGAMLIEIFLGLCFIVGFEVRFASLFFLIFLIMSLTFFGEAVWPHIILIGTAVSMFLHGYDKFSLSVWLEKDKNLEPVL